MTSTSTPQGKIENRIRVVFRRVSVFAAAAATMTLSRLPSVTAVEAKAVPLLSSALATLTFALNYSMQQFDRPIMNKIASGKFAAEMTLEDGKGLSGLDGAGQPGMTRAGEASGVLSSCVSNGRLQSSLIQRLFGAKSDAGRAGEPYEVDDKTASAHHAKLKRWLFGGTDQKGAGIHPAGISSAER